MQKLTEEEKQRIISMISGRVNWLKCPMCGNNQFSILDGYFNHTLQSDFNNLVLGGPSIPSVGIVCNKCGFISQHALGTLGLIPKKENPK